jgi:hypothetical protein
MKWFEYLSNPQYAADNLGKKRFGEELMLAFKQKNLSEGINGYQAAWLHKRIRNWKVNRPDIYGEDVVEIDIVNMIVAGDIETACFCIMCGEPDDMTKTYHWASADRMNWLIDQMKEYVGWL